jgi:hypothetical protein
VALQDCVAKSGTSVLKSQLEGSEYTYALASWPRGLELLIGSGSAEEAKALSDVIWQSALAILDPGSLRLLLTHRTEIHVGDWYDVCRGWSHLSNEDTDSAERAQRSKVFNALTYRLSLCGDLASVVQEPEVNEIKVQSEEWSLVYYIDELSVLAAESAWTAGFRNLNSTRSRVPPLWTILFREYWTLNWNWPVFYTWACCHSSGGGEDGNDSFQD